MPVRVHSSEGLGSTALGRRKDSCCEQEDTASGAVEQCRTAGLLQPVLCPTAKSRIRDEPEELERYEGRAEHQELLNLWARRIDELRKERGEEDQRLGVACADEEATHEAARLGRYPLFGVRQVAAGGEEGSDAKVGEIGGASPLEHGEEQLGRRQDRAQTDCRQHHDADDGTRTAQRGKYSLAEAAVDGRGDRHEYGRAGSDREDEDGGDEDEPGVEGHGDCSVLPNSVIKRPVGFGGDYPTGR
jgi:hypothetical protein